MKSIFGLLLSLAAAGTLGIGDVAACPLLVFLGKGLLFFEKGVGFALNRREQRELIFLLLFENIFTGVSLDEIKDSKLLVGELTERDFNGFVGECFNGTLENVATIDKLIEKNSPRWGKKRLSKVTLAILRLSVYEMLFRDDIPVSVSINEAVELSKKYGSEKESAFINGILGGISRSLEDSQQTT